MNYEFNLLHHVGVVAKKVRTAAAAHEGDNNTGPRGRKPLVPTLHGLYKNISVF